MTDPTVPARVPRRGTRVTASTRENRQVTSEHTEEEEETGRAMLFKHPAYVGLSVAKTRSTEFSRKKLEVAVWCSMPCGPSTPERRQAMDEAQEFAMDVLDTKFAEASDAFFPNTDWDGE